MGCKRCVNWIAEDRGSDRVTTLIILVIANRAAKYSIHKKVTDEGDRGD
jgi:hypothetical protein